MIKGLTEDQSKLVTHQVTLFNDNKLNGETVFYSMQLYFLTLLTDEQISKITEAIFINDEWICPSGCGCEYKLELQIFESDKLINDTSSINFSFN